MNDSNAGPATFQLPAIVRWLGLRLPAWPPAAALAGALTLALGRLIDAASMQPLKGKCIELRVTDAGLCLRLTFTGHAFLPVWDSGSADVGISASAYDFSLLARRKADPDSLFFSRRLLIEGDTELGLLIKNALDSVDISTLWRRLSSLRLR